MIPVLAAMLIMCACANEKTQPLESQISPVPTVEEKEPPKPGRILIGPEGFDTKEKKIIYVKSGSDQSTFRLVDRDTKDTIYVGELKKLAIDMDDEEHIYCGEFTSFGSEGIFEIEIGDEQEHTEVSIEKDADKKRYAEGLEALERLKPDGDRSRYYRLAVMMLASDIYDDSYVDWVFINKETKECLDHETELLDLDDEKYAADISDRLIAAGLLAEYYSVYGEIEEGEVAQSLETAVQIYNRCIPYREEASEVALYFANAGLNRVTGFNEYRKGIEENEKEITKDGEYDDFMFIADMMYLRSRNIGDFAGCESMVEDFLDKAAQVAKEADIESFCISEDIKVTGQGDELDDLMICAVADYILSENAYIQTRRDYVHYLEGRNPEEIRYIDDYKSEIKTMTKLVFILGSQSEEYIKSEEE